MNDSRSRIRYSAGSSDRLWLLCSLLAGDVGLAHRRADAPTPLDIQIAKPAVAVAVRVIGAVLLPEQEQGHAAATQFGVDMLPTPASPGSAHC